MYRRSIVTLATLTLLTVPTSAVACERDPISFRLPGETEAQAFERANRIDADRWVAGLYNREATDFANATHVYLARVISKTRSPRSTVVTPLEALKGERKNGTQTLIDDGGPGLCDDRGDGFGAQADTDALVVVFEGLPTSPERPRGVDSLRVNDIRTPPLLYKLMGRYGPKYE